MCLTLHFSECYIGAVITTSESETSLKSDVDTILASLPALRRWLLDSAPESNKNKSRAKITLSQVRIIIHLYQHGPLQISQLAQGIGISSSTTSEQVTALEARGRVVRTRSDFDQRGVVVSLTPEAETIAAAVQGRRRNIVEAVMRESTEYETKACTEGVTLMAKKANGWMGEEA